MVTKLTNGYKGCGGEGREDVTCSCGREKAGDLELSHVHRHHVCFVREADTDAVGSRLAVDAGTGCH